MQQQQFINNCNQLDMFQAIILPIFRSTRLCVYSLWYKAPTMLLVGSLEAEFLRFQATGRQRLGCVIPQVVTHSIALLKMGEIVAQNMLSWMELLINRYYCI